MHIYIFMTMIIGENIMLYISIILFFISIAAVGNYFYKKGIAEGRMQVLQEDIIRSENQVKREMEQNAQLIQYAQR
jgi:hypothetical protein